MATIESVWPEWHLDETPLGRGSYGVVYKATRGDHNVESEAAIKIISIPSDPSKIDSLRSEGLDLDGTRTYLSSIVDDFVKEIQILESLKGVQNIVSVADYKVVEKTDTIGWDIYIRMELLTPFNNYICDKNLSEAEIIKLGLDICTALEICEKKNIIHRDIKPENIFVNEFGDFKIGDFGIARNLENMTQSLTQIGSLNYMAPEVAKGDKYDARTDIYSLGIVLYRLLNGNRLPFLDCTKQLLSHTERRQACERRLQGESLPAPINASEELAAVVLRACAFSPDERFLCASDMKNALLRVANGVGGIAAVSVNRKPSKNRRKLIIFLIILLIMALIAGVIYWLSQLFGGKDNGEASLPANLNSSIINDNSSNNDNNGSENSNVSSTDSPTTVCTNHIAGDWIIDEAATCATAGTRHTECTNCKVVLNIEKIPKLPHTEVVDAAVIPNGKQQGLTEGSHCSVCNQTIVRQERVPTTGWYFRIVDGEAIIDQYDGLARGRLVIPSEFYGYPVTTLERNLFENCTELTEVVIPDTVTEIPVYLFFGCTSLTKVVFPKNVTKIEVSAFGDCRSLTQIAIPAGVTEITDRTFEYCTALTDISIPKSVKSIKASAFEGCHHLTNVWYEGNENDKANIVYSESGSSFHYLSNANWHYNSYKIYN